MAEYPEWVMKYKGPGVYVKKLKNGYALYRGHSERVPGRKTPVFRCDEYIGIVTEEGLSPSKPSVRPGVKVLRYGVWALAERVCGHLRKGAESSGVNASKVFAASVLSMEGRCGASGYASSWFSVAEPDLDLERPLGPKADEVRRRMDLQIRTVLDSALGADMVDVVEKCMDVYAVHVNGRWVLSDMPEGLRELLERHGVELPVDERIARPRQQGHSKASAAEDVK